MRLLVCYVKYLTKLNSCIMFSPIKHYMLVLATLFVLFYGRDTWVMCVCVFSEREKLAAKRCVHSLPQLTRAEGKINRNRIGSFSGFVFFHTPGYQTLVYNELPGKPFPDGF